MFEKVITVDHSPESISWIFYELQEIAGEACAQWHATGAELALQGLMWVVVRYEVRMSRSFVSGEQIRLVTWASPFRHRMSQRNYIAYDDSGSIVFTAAGIWTVVDRKTRRMVNPEEYEIRFESEITGEEPPRPESPIKIPSVDKLQYTIPEEVLDINGHMNNTRYFDLVQKCSEIDTRNLRPERIQAVFMNEALLGEQILVQWGSRDGYWYYTGKKKDIDCFQIGIQYVIE